MAVTYPPAAPTVQGDSITIHKTLQSPATVAKRLQQLTDRRYIADFILPERLAVAGGALTYESGEPIGTRENPRAVAPGAEYPLVNVSGGTPSLAKTTKWGQDVLVTDEAIKRLRVTPVNRALVQLANQNVMHIDSVSMSAVTSAVQTAGSTHAAAAFWANATAEQILLDVLTTVAKMRQLELGIDPTAVVLDDLLFATVQAKFIGAGYLPREGPDNPVISGAFPRVQGLTWVSTPHGVANAPMVVDREQLGGMADEDLGSPGYARATADGQAGVEVKSIREDAEDRYRLRARRVTVPVVLEPLAGRLITGTAA